MLCLLFSGLQIVEVFWNVELLSLMVIARNRLDALTLIRMMVREEPQASGVDGVAT